MPLNIENNHINNNILAQINQLSKAVDVKANCFGRKFFYVNDKGNLAAEHVIARSIRLLKQYFSGKAESQLKEKTQLKEAGKDFLTRAVNSLSNTADLPNYYEKITKIAQKAGVTSEEINDILILVKLNDKLHGQIDDLINECTKYIQEQGKIPVYDNIHRLKSIKEKPVNKFSDKELDFLLEQTALQMLFSLPESVLGEEKTTKQWNEIEELADSIPTSLEKLNQDKELNSKKSATIESVVEESINKNENTTSTHNFKIFQEIDTLMGADQKLSETDKALLKNFLKKLEEPTISAHLERNCGFNGKNVFKEFLIQIKNARDLQLKSIASGEGVLSSTHLVTTSMMNLWAELIMLLPELELTQNARLNTLLSALTERAVVRNNQIITDLIYPNCVLYLDGKIAISPNGPMSRRIATSAEVEKNEGPNKGFMPRDGSNLIERQEWENVLTNGTVFMKGFCKFSFKTPQGSKSESGVYLDLSSLGKLTRLQVETIFNLARDIIKDGSENKTYEKFIKGYEENLKALTPTQLAFLKKIITNFAANVETALNLAILSVGETSPDTPPFFV